MPPALRPGEEVTVVCSHLDDRGAGVGDSGGIELRVAGALPGERVNAVVEHLSPHAPQAWARLEAVLDASSQRVAPVCPAYGPCGGCPLQHLAYPAQVAWKTDLVRAAAARRPELASVPVTPCVPSPRPLGYRNQGKYVYGPTGDGRVVLGAYAPRSHAVVDLAGCQVVEPPVDRVAGRLAAALARHQVVPWDERRRQGDLRYAVIRASAAEEVLVTLVAGRRGWASAGAVAGELRAADRAVSGVVLNVNDSPGNFLYGEEDLLLAGSPTLPDRIGPLALELSARSFFQVNRGIAARAYQDLLQAAAALAPLGRVVDAYAGAGGIAFTLAPLAAQVVAIEESAAAAAAAAQGAARITTPIQVLAGDAAEHLAAVGTADLVVLNPPRAGCALPVLHAAAALHPRLIAYLSCNPTTLMRDLAVLRERGFVTSALRPYDMLPHTAHVETLALVAPVRGC
jgi:23S rRNA (uracil1939-C5)-methyltransferase